MIVRRRFVIILLLCWHSAGLAHSQPEKSINEIMTEIGAIVTRLFPIIFSEKTLSDRQNKEIYSSVEKLQTLFKTAKPHIQKKSLTYQVSYQLLQDYLDDILQEDNPATLPNIKKRLSTLSNFCVSCHTQDSQFRTLFKDRKRPVFTSYLTQAEFHYATRNYREAHQYYEKYLSLGPEHKEGEILKILNRVLSIYTQILNNPAEAIQALNNIRKQNKFSKNITNHIHEATEALSDLQRLNVNEIKLVTFPELRQYATQYLAGITYGQAIITSSPREEVERLWLRGLLFRYLNYAPKKEEMPFILYWLALCDLSLGYDYDNILADFYIKQCIKRYSSHKFSKFCFAEYKEYIQFYFTTVQEPVIPFEVNNELKELERYIKQ